MYRVIKAASESDKMNSQDMLRNLHCLDNKLRENNMKGEIDLYGGYVMCLGLNALETIHDIDAIFEPKSEIKKLVQEVAIENNLPDDWMNDEVKEFISDKGEFIRYDEEMFTNLSIFMTSPQYLFAMKCLSCRMGYENETEIKDIKFLISYLNIESVEDAEDIILQYYPVSRYKPKTHFMLIELFSK